MHSARHQKQKSHKSRAQFLNQFHFAFAKTGRDENTNILRSLLSPSPSKSNPRSSARIPWFLGSIWIFLGGLFVVTSIWCARAKATPTFCLPPWSFLGVCENKYTCLQTLIHTELPGTRLFRNVQTLSFSFFLSFFLSFSLSLSLSLLLFLSFALSLLSFCLSAFSPLCLCLSLCLSLWLQFVLTGINNLVLTTISIIWLGRRKISSDYSSRIWNVSAWSGCGLYCWSEKGVKLIDLWLVMNEARRAVHTPWHMCGTLAQ